MKNMKRIELKSVFTEYQSAELPDSDKALLAKAKEAMLNAYAPYSQFKVGAALFLSNGEYVLGNNQENLAYPSGLCAERVALFSFGARNSEAIIQSMGIIAMSKDNDFSDYISPCGACLQVLSEFQKKQNTPIRVVLANKAGNALVCEGVTNLLPLQFEGGLF